MTSRIPVALRRVANRFRRIGRAPVRIWYHPEYRLPLAGAEGVLGIEPRRADFVVGYLVDAGAIDEQVLQRPRRIAYSELSLVHTPELLERLHDVAELARPGIEGRGTGRSARGARRHPVGTPRISSMFCVQIRPLIPCLHSKRSRNWRALALPYD